MYHLLGEGETIEIVLSGKETVTTKQIERKGGRLFMRTKKRLIDPLP